MGRAALVGHTCSAAVQLWTCVQVKQVGPVKHSLAGVSGPGASGMDGGWLSDRFHVPDRHC